LKNTSHILQFLKGGAGVTKVNHGVYPPDLPFTHIEQSDKTPRVPKCGTILMRGFRLKGIQKKYRLFGMHPSEHKSLEYGGLTSC